VMGLAWLGSTRRLATLSAEQIFIWEQPGTGGLTLHRLIDAGRLIVCMETVSR
jgi:hypothetical protein